MLVSPFVRNYPVVNQGRGICFLNRGDTKSREVFHEACLLIRMGKDSA